MQIIYSNHVEDSFFISINLPRDYHKESKIKYPVVYLLDGNFYFDMVASICKSYEEIGLLPPIILVGIGYKDLYKMDSLRNRDYTFPKAIPSYEMEISGKADRFLSFIDDELIKYIDTKFSTDKEHRILMGHSLGGFFVLYAMLENQKKNNAQFTNYISASPSTNYNNDYIMNEFTSVKWKNKSNAFISFGGLEDTEDNEVVLLKSNEVLERIKSSFAQSNGGNCETVLFSNLNHMETALPSFFKGMEWTFSKRK